MPKFASQRLIFGAVVRIFRGEAESGLEILMVFLVEISAYWSKFLPREGWGAIFGRWRRKEVTKKCLKLCSRFFGSKLFKIEKNQKMEADSGHKFSVFAEKLCPLSAC